MPASTPSDEGLETRKIDPSERRATLDDPWPDPADGADPRLIVQRYLVIEEIGRGGMGRVMRAYDPKLEREVALKFLKAETFDPQGRARLLREARIMAKLNHPNVVAVYDVDVDPDHGVIIAMELVRGTTLDCWLVEQCPSPLQVLQTFGDAGRGLAAAHRAGLLHRDFKPSNVLVASDGRARVTDFGIAKPHGDLLTSLRSGRWRPRGSLPSPGPSPGRSLTDPDTVLGTPKYMSPEQHNGRDLTPAADQYAFCLALWETLVDEYPFTVAQLRRAKAEGPPAWPATPGVPRAIGEALRRGLAPRSEDRWPDMDSLLVVLSRRPERRRRWWWMSATIAATGLGAVGWTISRDSSRDRLEADTSMCRAKGEAIADVWNDEVERKVRDGLRATEAIYAERTTDTVIDRLDRQAREWRVARTESCLDAEVRRVWDAPTRARAEWCLDDRRLELGAFIEELNRADAEVIQRAVDATANLAPIAPCRDTTMLQQGPQLPPADDRPLLADVRAKIFRAQTLQAAGKYSEGLDVLDPLIEQLEHQGWSLLLARAKAAEANLQRALGAYDRAEEAGRTAYMEAVGVGAWHLASSVASTLACNVGLDLVRPDDGLLWIDHARAFAKHADDIQGILEGKILVCVAGIEFSMGKYEDAKLHYQDALAIMYRTWGPSHPKTIDIMVNQAVTYHNLGLLDEARELFEHALELKEQSLGEDHPAIASGLTNLATMHMSTGHYVRARELYWRARDIYERTLDPAHPKIAKILTGLASIYRKEGDLTSAQRLNEQAIGIIENAHGPDHPDLAAYLNNLANLHTHNGNNDEARRLYERARDLTEASLSPDHPKLVKILTNLASVVPEDQAARLRRRVAELREHAKARAERERIELRER